MKLVFVVHDAGDPNGTPIGELTRATQKWVRVQYNGDGEGGFTINRHETQAAWFEPSADPVYIKAYLDDTSGDPIFGFLPDSGGDTILAAEEQGAQEYIRSGKGGLSYLADAILFNSDFTNNDAANPEADGNWRWGSTNLGAILLRQIEEAQARGCFPDVTVTFDRTDDSASDAWTIVAAEYKLPIGMNLREACSALQSAGLIVRMDPDLTLHAWNDHPGADVSGSVILTPAENLRDSVERQVQASPAISTALVQGDLESGALKFRTVNDAGVLADIGRRKEGYVQYNATPTNAVLDAVGQKSINATKAQYDGPTSVPVLIRANEVPFTDYQPGDLIGVSLPGAAGSIRVAAIALVETDTGEVDPVLDLGEETFDPIEGLGSGPSRGSAGPGGTGGGPPGGGGGVQTPPRPLPLPYDPGVVPANDLAWRSEDGILISGPSDDTWTGNYQVETDEFATLMVSLGGANATVDATPAGWTPHPANPAVAGSGRVYLYYQVGTGSPDSVTIDWTPASAVNIVLYAIEGAEAFQGWGSAQDVGTGVLFGPIDSHPGSHILIDGSGVATGLVTEVPPPPTGTDDFAILHQVDVTHVSASAIHDWPYEYQEIEEVGGTVDASATWSALSIAFRSAEYPVPLLGTPVLDETVGTGDGVTTTFTTGFPYVPGSLRVRVDGLDVQADVATFDPAGRSFTLDFAPSGIDGSRPAETVSVDYVIA